MTMPGGKAGEPLILQGGSASRRAATEISASTIDVGNSLSEQASAARGVRQRGQRRRGSHRSDIAVPEADPDGQSTHAIAPLLATEIREDMLAILRQISERNPFAERLAYSPDEAAELLGISRELVHADDRYQRRTYGRTRIPASTPPRASGRT
jgi:hypothetical protein